MTREEAIEVFKGYLRTGYVPRPYQLQEASKIAIECINRYTEPL